MKMWTAVASCAFALYTLSGQADIAYLGMADGYWQVWVMDDDGQQSRQVTRSEYDKSRISWFPDGQRLLINGNDGLLRIVDVNDGSESALTLELSGMLDATLRPDGQQVAFSLSTSGSVDDNNIWTYDLHSHELSKLTQLTHLQHEPSWSWSSERIYFLSGDGGQAHDIWFVDLNDRRVEQLTTSSLYNFDVNEGPDGTLAFSSNRSGNYEIWIAQPEQLSTPKQLTDHPALDARPSWSFDGSAIAFESSRSGEMNIWLVEVETGVLQQLTRQPGGARFPVWGTVVTEERSR